MSNHTWVSELTSTNPCRLCYAATRRLAQKGEARTDASVEVEGVEPEQMKNPILSFTQAHCLRRPGRMGSKARQWAATLYAGLLGAVPCDNRHLRKGRRAMAWPPTCIYLRYQPYGSDHLDPIFAQGVTHDCRNRSGLALSAPIIVAVSRLFCTNQAQRIPEWPALLHSQQEYD
jgi:hypothetical protein